MNKHSHRNSIKKRDSELESLLHSEHTVQIEKLVVGGNGLTRIAYQEKSLVVFVDRVAPGEKVRIKISAVEKNHLIGELLDILEPSPERRIAPCKYFDSCGGCSWQHISETEQIRQKEQILADLLKKFIPETTTKLLHTVVSEKNLHYRNRIQLKQLGNQLGYFQKSSHQIVDIDACLLAQEEISSQIIQLKKSLRPTNDLKKYELRINHLEQFEHYPIGTDGEGLSFSQVNNGVNSLLVSEVVKIVRELAPTFITEFYAGAGNFTFSLLKALPELRIESAELNSKLTAFASRLLTEQKLQKRLFAFTTDCESFAERRALSQEMVLLDPPRSGCSEIVIKKLLESNTRHILYISCHPVFLMRDLKRIINENPAYKIKHLQIFDMFPQTDHFETLVLLSRHDLVD